MKTVMRAFSLGLLLLCSVGCAFSQPKARSASDEIERAVAIAFGVQPEATLASVLKKIEMDVKIGSSPEQVMAYLGAVKTRSPVEVKFSRQARGQPLVRDLKTDEKVIAYFVDAPKRFDISIYFYFDDKDGFTEVDAARGVWER